MRKLYLLPLMLMVFSCVAQAQLTYDVISFENNVTMPSSKAYNNTLVVSLSGIDWTMPGVYLGTMDAQDFKMQNNSARFRRLNDAVGANGYMETQEDFTQGFEYFGFYGAMYGSDAGGVLQLSYSTNQGSTWTALDTFEIAPNNNPTLYISHEHIIGNVRFRLSKIDNTDARINVDSIFIIPMGAPPDDLEIVYMLPQGSTTPKDELSLVFNQHIEEGASGNITVVNMTTNTSQVFAIGGPNIRLNSDTMVIENVTLLPFNDYYVLVDSTVAESEYNGDLSPGIYDSTQWVINVIPSHLQNTFSDFSVCDLWGNLGVFKQYSVIDGSRRWNCEIEGTDTFIAMSGNNGTASAVQNEDWLVSILPFDFNDRAAMIKFKERKKGTGNNVVRKVSYTTNFNVNITTTTWQDYTTIADDFVDDNWKTKEIQLSGPIVAAKPFLAISYTNQANASQADAWQWAIDDFEVIVDTSLSVNHIENILPSCYIAYPTASNQIDIGLFSNENIDAADFIIMDIAGRQMHAQRQSVQQGMNAIRLQPINLTSGMYVLKVLTNKGFITKKFLINQ